MQRKMQRKMHKKLYAYQKEDISTILNFLERNSSHSCYIASEMGVGKTAEALSVINKLDNCKSVLIVCPAVMRLVWADEISEWCELDARVQVCLGKIKEITRPEHYDPHDMFFCIVSYDLAAKKENLEKLMSQKWDVLILDESHFCKSYKAKRTKACLKHLWDTATYHLALSGTPMTGSVVDAYPLFRKMCPEKIGDFDSFVREYVYSRVTPWGVEYSGVKNPEKLKRIIRDNFYLRRTKEEVLRDLPPKVFTRITLPEKYLVRLPQNDEEKLRSIAASYLQYIEKGVSPPPAPASLASLQRHQGIAKVSPVVEFAKNMLDVNIPCVIFAWHTDVIKMIESELSSYFPVVITGDTSMKKRHAHVKAFQGGETNLFIGQMSAAGVGITLTRAAHVLLAELYWSPSIISQAVDRCHRIGAKNTVNIYYFVVENSIDLDIAETVVRKAKDFAQVLER